MSARRAYRVRLWRESPHDLQIVYSAAAAYRMAQDSAWMAFLVAGGPVRLVQVMVREPGETRWALHERIWRRGQHFTDPAGVGGGVAS